VPPEDAFTCPGRGAHYELAELERRRAAQAAARAARHEAQEATAADELRPVHARLGALHRRTEQRHLAAARLHHLLAVRMEHWLSHPDDALGPAFLAAVADVLGTTSALAVLRGQRAVAKVGASDSVALAAHDLETVTGEGPALEAATAGVPVMAAGPALLDRWPRYGPAAAELGVAAAIAAPLGPPAARLGALCALGCAPVIRGDAASAMDGVTAVLTRVLLDAAYQSASGDLPASPLVGAAGSQAVIHQAAGMVSVQCGCGVDDAADLLAARAFADGLPVAEVARRVVRGETLLADG
jgi:hypothetical protein